MRSTSLRVGMFETTFCIIRLRIHTYHYHAHVIHRHIIEIVNTFQFQGDRCASFPITIFTKHDPKLLIWLPLCAGWRNDVRRPRRPIRTIWQSIAHKSHYKDASAAAAVVVVVVVVFGCGFIVGPMHNRVQPARSAAERNQSDKQPSPAPSLSPHTTDTRTHSHTHTVINSTNNAGVMVNSKQLDKDQHPTRFNRRQPSSTRHFGSQRCSDSFIDKSRQPQP